MAIDFSKDIRSLTESDLAGLTADELKLLGRLCVSEPIRGTSPFDPDGVEMSYSGNGATQRCRVHPDDVAVATLKGWVRA